MTNYQNPTPKVQPEVQRETRSLRETLREQPKPMPEVGRRPRFLFTDFASI